MNNTINNTQDFVASNYRFSTYSKLFEKLTFLTP